MTNLQLKINLDFQQLLEIVKQLSHSEKIELNEILWKENLNIPMEHQELVLGRIENSKKNPNRMQNWDDALKKLKD